jgi:hypothetical protein
MEPARSYFAVIPAQVRYSKNICANSKLMYGEITALSNERGYCFAGNSYFSQLYGVSISTISRWVKELSDEGFIICFDEITQTGKQRRIKIANSFMEGSSQKCEEGSTHFCEGGLRKNAKHNSIVNNIELYNTIPETSSGLDFENTPPAQHNAEKKKTKGKERVTGAKKTDPAHTPCVQIYFDWYKERTGHEATPDAGDYNNLSKLLKRLRKIASLPDDDKDKTSETFSRFLNSFPKWSKFQQSQIRLKDINSQFQNIILELEKHKSPEKHTADNPTTETIYGDLINPDFKYPSYGKL